MSRTFLHRGRRVDFDLWMLPDLSLDLDFDLLASMVTGTYVPNSFSGPIDRFVREAEEELEPAKVASSFQFAAGAWIAAAGIAVLAPGPMYAVVAYYGGPIGVAAYVAFGLVLVGVGTLLMWTA